MEHARTPLAVCIMLLLRSPPQARGTGKVPECCDPVCSMVGCAAPCSTPATMLTKKTPGGQGVQVRAACGPPRARARPAALCRTRSPAAPGARRARTRRRTPAAAPPCPPAPPGAPRAARTGSAPRTPPAAGACTPAALVRRRTEQRHEGAEGASHKERHREVQCNNMISLLRSCCCCMLLQAPSTGGAGTLQP